MRDYKKIDSEDLYTLRDHVTDLQTWKRILYMIFFGIVFYCSAWIILAVVLVQVIFKITTGKPLSYLAAFGYSLGQYTRQIVLYETFSTNVRPWPFSTWPNKKTTLGHKSEEHTD